MSKTSIWFPFFPDDWLSSTRIAIMSAEEERGYLRLMCHCWNGPECSLPDDDNILARLSLMGEGWLKGGCRLVRVCFTPHPNQTGRLTQPKLYEKWVEQQNWREKSARGGRHSAESRQNRAKGGCDLVATKSQPNVNSPSPSPSPKETPRARDLTTHTPEHVPLTTGGSAASRQNAIALLQHFATESKRIRGLTPALDYAGPELHSALTVLHATPLQEARKLVTRYLGLDDSDLASKGWPWPLFRHRIGALQAAKAPSESSKASTRKRLEEQQQQQAAAVPPPADVREMLSSLAKGKTI